MLECLGNLNPNLNPKPYTLNPKPYTLDPKPKTLNRNLVRGEVPLFGFRYVIWIAFEAVLFDADVFFLQSLQLCSDVRRGAGA